MSAYPRHHLILWGPVLAEPIRSLLQFLFSARTFARNSTDRLSVGVFHGLRKIAFFFSSVTFFFYSVASSVSSNVSSDVPSFVS